MGLLAIVAVVASFIWWLKWQQRQRPIPKSTFLNEVMEPQTEELEKQLRPEEEDRTMSDSNVPDQQRHESGIADHDTPEIQPDSHSALYKRGNALYALGSYKDALACYEQALEIKPDSNSAWNNRANVLYSLERYEDALACYERSLSIQPDYALAWYNKACCYAKLDNVDLALENLKRAIDLNPNYSEIAKSNSDFEKIKGY